MTALLTQVCRRTMVFARASLAWSAGMLRRPVTSARRVREAPKLPSSRGTSPMGLAGTDGDRTRVTPARDQAAAAVPRSAAGCQRINAVRWRPRPSGRRWSGRGADLDELLLQACHRPIFDRLWRRQRAQEIAEVVGERVKVKSNSVSRERPT